MTNRPRSTADVLYSDRVGFDLAHEGRKICTSRYGFRTELKQGDVATFMCNDGSKECFQIEVLFVNHKAISDINPAEAWAISNYTQIKAYNNFKEIYESLGKEVDFNTPATLVWFKKL